MRKAKNFGAESDIEFPLTLGRDFSGTVVSKGHGVGERLKLGDEVWGVVPVEQQGCHAEYVITSECLVKFDCFQFPNEFTFNELRTEIFKIAIFEALEIW